MSALATTADCYFQNLKAVFQLTNVLTVHGHMAESMQNMFVQNATLRNMKLMFVMKEKLYSAQIVTNGSFPNEEIRGIGLTPLCI